MSEHTPGPWSIKWHKTSANFDQDGSIDILAGETNIPIANVSLKWATGHDNALLIAAAPELLTVGIKLAEWIRVTSDPWDDDVTELIGEWEEVVNKARSEK